MGRALFAVVVGVAVALAGVAVAWAHAEPATVSPGDGAVLAAGPLSVEIEMTQEMARREGANDIDVFDAAGKEVTTVAAVIDNGDRKKLTVALPSGLATGTYTVKWKSLSADDGDSAEGSLTFTVDPSRTPSPGKTALKDEPVTGGEGNGDTPAAIGPGDGGGGTSWVVVGAVALGTFVIGSGSTYLLVQKRG